MNVLLLSGLPMVAMLFKELLETAFQATVHNVEPISGECRADRQAAVEEACKKIPQSDFAVVILDAAVWNPWFAEIAHHVGRAGKKVIYVAKKQMEVSFSRCGALEYAPDGVWITEGCPSALRVIMEALGR